MRKLYQSGDNLVAKPNRNSRYRYDIEIGVHMYSVGVKSKHVSTVSFIGHHLLCPSESDDINDSDDLDEVRIMDDGKILASFTHMDC